MFTKKPGSHASTPAPSGTFLRLPSEQRQQALVEIVIHASFSPTPGSLCEIGV